MEMGNEMERLREEELGTEESASEESVRRQTTPPEVRRRKDTQGVGGNVLASHISVRRGFPGQKRHRRLLHHPALPIVVRQHRRKWRRRTWRCSDAWRLRLIVQEEEEE